MKRKLAVSALLFVVSINQIFAQNTVFASNSNSTIVAGVGAEMGQATYNGSGCPAGSVSTTLSPDQTALSVLFDSYTVQTSGLTTSDRKTCDITIPFVVPDGFQIGIVRTDYRGFYNLPDGASSNFRVEYFLAGKNAPSYTNVFNGPLAQNFLLQNTVHTEAVLWSECGSSANFRINTDLSVFTNSSLEETLATLDSTDIKINDPSGSRGLDFYFVSQPCSTNAASSAAINYFTAGLLAGAVLLAL